MFAYRCWEFLSYCDHTLQTAVQPVHVLQHVLQACCDIADKEFALVLKVGLFIRPAIGGGHCRCRMVKSRMAVRKWAVTRMLLLCVHVSRVSEMQRCRGLVALAAA